MPRQRGELVPIGEALADLGGPVQALRKTPPPARRGFTVADQVNQLVSASEADSDLGFMARMMALCSLPRTNPGNRKEYKRVNGPFTLYIIAGGGSKLPFDNLPRPRPVMASRNPSSNPLQVKHALAEFLEMRRVSPWITSPLRAKAGPITWTTCNSCAGRAIP